MNRRKEHYESDMVIFPDEGAAAHWVVEGAEGELPKEARHQLRQVLENYDAEMR